MTTIQMYGFLSYVFLLIALVGIVVAIIGLFV